MTKLRVAFLIRGAVSKTSGAFGTDANPTDVVTENYVNYVSVRKSIEKYIIDANKDIATFDCFIHSWNVDLESELTELYDPVKSEFEDNAQYKHWFAPYKYVAQISQSLTIKKGIELIESTDVNYDYVIIYRPDVLLWKSIRLETYDNGKIYVNGIGRPRGDFHFIMNMKNASKFKNLFNSAELGNEPKTHHWIENYVKNYMKEVLYSDNIGAGIHQEVLRKLYKFSYKKGHISESILTELGLTVREISNWS